MYKEVEGYFNESYPYLVKQLVARRVDPYDAEDIVQEAFYRSIKYIKSYDPSFGKFGEWFSKILNRCHKDYTRDLIMRGMSVEVKEDHIICEEDFGHNNRIKEEIAKEINTLVGVTRNVCFLHYVKGLGPKDISKVMDVTPKVAGQMIYMFKKHLVEKYEA